MKIFEIKKGTIGVIKTVAGEEVKMMCKKDTSFFIEDLISDSVKDWNDGIKEGVSVEALEVLAKISKDTEQFAEFRLTQGVHTKNADFKTIVFNENDVKLVC